MRLQLDIGDGRWSFQTRVLWQRGDQGTMEKLNATSPCLLAGHVKLAKLQLKKSCCYINVVYHTFDQVGQRPTSLLDGSSVLVSTLLAAPYISKG